MTAGRTINSLSRDWATPKKYVNAVKQVLGTISLDPCSNQYSIVPAETKYTLPTDGLAESWNFPTIYVNPPYGADRERGTTIKNWISRCASAYTENHSEVLALIPVATNTSHWKNYIWKVATSICFLYDTRLKFLIEGIESKKGAPMACAMIYWGRHPGKFNDVFSEFGAVVHIYTSCQTVDHLRS